jgi:hypothetical protein
MKLPRFSLRTLFVLIALISIPLSWVAYQLNWIRQRHQFLRPDGPVVGWSRRSDRLLPWSLRLCGEHGMDMLQVRQADSNAAQKLFPESAVEIMPNEYRTLKPENIPTSELVQ